MAKRKSTKRKNILNDQECAKVKQAQETFKQPENLYHNGYERGRRDERELQERKRNERADPRAVIFREDGHVPVQSLRSEVLLHEATENRAEITRLEAKLSARTTLQKSLELEMSHRGLIKLV